MARDLNSVPASARRSRPSGSRWRPWRQPVLVLLVVVPAALGESPPTAAQGPSAIPVAEVTRRAAEVAGLVRDMDAQLASPQVARIDRDLDRLRERLAERFARTQRAIEARRGLRMLDDLTESWESSRLTLAAWMDILTTRAVWIEHQRERVAQAAGIWTRTRDALSADGAPQPVIDRVDGVLALLPGARARLEEQRTATLVLQDRVAQSLTHCGEALDAIGRARRQAAGDLLLRESPPIWALRPLGADEFSDLVRTAVATQRALLERFLQDQSDNLLIHGALMIGLVLLFTWVGRRASRWATAGAPIQSLAVLIETPVTAGLTLGLLAGAWIYSEEPPAARLLVETGALVPTVMILRRLVPASVKPALYTLAAFFVADRLREFVVSFPVIERSLFLVEMLAAAAVLAWLVRSGRADEIVRAAPPGLGAPVAVMLRLAIGGFLVAFVSGAVGNMSLARLIGSGILGSANLAVVLGAGRRLAEGLVAFALRVRPLRFLRSATFSRAVVERRVHVVLRAVVSFLWVVGTLDYFGGLAPTGTAARAILGAELTWGALRVSLGDVVAFGLTLWLAFHLSSLVHYILEEDVFPRLNLRPGLPYALSTFVRYAIVFVGFIVALLVLGVNLDRVTVLGGALGVGIGFGLQNIVNNFVSGLIVLFERPVRVGNVVQIGDVQGEVVRIGIRSSTVRTGEGAEVIVPNSQLVADKVTNWTPADESRRLDVPVTVAYGPTPGAVLKVLSEAAHAHPDVVARPAPQILFLGFGDGGLRFELRAWTTRLTRFPEVKSELGIAVYGALREAGIALAVPQQELRIRQEPPAAEAVRPPRSAS